MTRGGNICAVIVTAGGPFGNGSLRVACGSGAGFIHFEHGSSKLVRGEI